MNRAAMTAMIFALSVACMAQEASQLPKQDLDKLTLNPKFMSKEDDQPYANSVRYSVGGFITNRTDWEIDTITFEWESHRHKPYYKRQFSDKQFQNRATNLMGTLMPGNETRTSIILAIPKTEISEWWLRIVSATGWRKPAAGALAGGLFAEMYRGHTQEVLRMFQQRPGLMDANDGTTGTSSIHIAAAANDVDLLAYLLKGGASLQAHNRARLTPLHTAARSNAAATVRFLIQQGAEMDAQTEAGLTALDGALEFSAVNAAFELLSAGADLSKVTKEGDSALHYASHCKGVAPLLKLLLRQGAPVNVPNALGETPLHYAAYYNNPDLARALLSVGATVNARTTKEGETALQWAAKYGRVEILTDLLRARANVDLPNAQGETPLHLAAAAGETKCFELLLEARANPNAQRNNGDTPLHLAISRGHSSLVGPLVQAGAKVDAVNKQGETSLLVACASEFTNCTRELLANGANVNIARPHDGFTPLHAAAATHSVGCLMQLIEAKAPLNVRNAQGQTALDIAREKNFQDIVDLLQQASGGGSRPY